MRPILSLAAALSVFCTAAAAEPSPTAAAPAAVVLPLDVPHPPAPPPQLPWLHRPSGYDMANYYPLYAAERLINGHVTLVCTVAGDGHLAGCKATAIMPPGQNFEWASLKLVPHFQLDVKPPKGDPALVGTVVSIPIGWVAPHVE
jgi:hypothetical protein